jgi:hypothetical protein
MSDRTPHNDDLGEVEYERQDLNPASILGFFIALIVLGVLIQFVVTGMLHLFERYNAKHQPEQNPLVQAETDTRKVTIGDIQKFPNPRLEDNERRELRDFRLQEEQTLNSYGVDQGAGTQHMPIDRAMQLIVEQGLPTKPQVGTVPISVVNTARQAAAKSDTSGAPVSKKK